VARAIVFASYGGPEVLELVEVGEERPAAGQVRVRVEAAGVQPFDCALRRGDLARWMPLRLPSRLGNELAGTVEEVGEGAGHLAPGDEVLGWAPLASHAEAVVVDAAQLVRKPAGMPWEEAGVLSASGQTADSALEALGVGPGDTVLVHAAAGGVGAFAVQLAALRGATVIGTASGRNHDHLRELGAIPVAYGPGLEDRVRRLSPGGVDAVLDAAGGEALDVSVRLVADRDRIGTVADRAGAARLGVRVLGTERTAGRLAGLADLVARGRLRVTISASLPLRDAAAAHRLVETGHVRGKVVLRPGLVRSGA
jgi:enoyl reductase